MPRRARPLSPWRLISAPLAERLAVAQDPATDRGTLTVVPPTAQDAEAPTLTELVVAVLTHPAGRPPAVASRYAGHPDPAVRRLVLNVPGLPATSLDALTYDPEPDIATEARRLLGVRHD